MQDFFLISTFLPALVRISGSAGPRALWTCKAIQMDQPVEPGAYRYLHYLELVVEDLIFPLYISSRVKLFLHGFTVGTFNVGSFQGC